MDRLVTGALEAEKVGKPLEGNVAIVTGAAGGIGRAYARGLAEAGASVVIADLNAEGAEQVAADLEKDGFKAMGLKLDVTDPASADAMVEATKKKFGRIDTLVNNAALMAEIPKDGLCDISLDLWERAMRVNVTGPLICTRAVVPTMKEQGVGHIINQASAAAFLPGSVYRITKHTLVALTAGLAVELGKFNINVNAIAPGLIMSEAGYKSVGAPGTPKREARYSSIPHARPDRPPSDLVGTLVLLASPAGDFINGQTINVDGGWVIRL
ncbi:MAG TPA: SDR family oxidoreductase [Candidatus Limnocylindria bacterium]|nr:SDR family oxidoreductase [Candidatus Limnocylindria bacterium]